MSKLAVMIDGSSLLSTSFYGTLDRRYHSERTEEGKQQYLDKLLRLSNGDVVNGVYGMVKSIEAMISKVQPTHVVIAWDISRNTFRREIYPEYKAQRAKTLPELKSQFALAQKLFSELGMAQYSFENYEADDVLGTLSNMFEDEISVAIWTKDQDAIQLVSERTSLWLVTSKAKDMYLERGIHPKHCLIPTGVFEHNPYTIEEHYGIRPIQIIDLKAIEGDASDNIPGVAGVGKKTALPLIQEFEDVKGIYDYLESDKTKEIKLFLKELGISSPLKKMMDEITPKDVIGEIALIIEEHYNEISDNALSLIGYKSDMSGVEASTIAGELRALDEKDLKMILRNLKKDALFTEAVNKVGEFLPGKAKEIAFMCKKLATIERNIPALKSVTLSDLLLELTEETKMEVFKKYEFKSLIK